MPLNAGTRLGTFEIIGLLGAGGMGEVYRARDSKLHRDVAIKVLPDTVGADEDRLARLGREARALAALNHPNIAQVFGVEDGSAGTAPHIVMELVEGEDLAARIAEGPLPTDEALAIARQVAEALDAAHAAGIVHRDLKPANVKVRADGAVKVLDFGLAKALEGPGFPVRGSLGEGRSLGITNSPTFTSPAVTQGGMILGTASYMSPEQARGRTVDKRTDIWAFGCVLYEMLVGRPVFDGETTTDVLGAIVKSDPDWSKLPVDTPHTVDRLLRRCLQKDPSRRLRDIGDAIPELAITDVPGLKPEVSGGPPETRRPGPGSSLLWIAGVVVVAAAAGAIGYYTRPAPTPQLQKFNIAIQQPGAHIRQPAISPDGRSVAYVGASRIYVQSLDALLPRDLVGTEAATKPFWSPAGDWIAYVRAEALLKVPVSGGPVVRIATLPAVQAPLGGSSGVWLEDGTIILSLASGQLLTVPSGGGNVKPFTNIEPSVALDLHDVHVLPGGALLCVLHRETGLDAIGVLKDGSLKVILQATNVARPNYSPSGHLVFERHAPHAGLWGAAFSIDRLEVTGDPFLIGVGAELTMARDGTMAFLSQPQEMARQLAWFTFNGVVGARIAEPREWIEGVNVSRDGSRVLASTIDGIWTYDVETGARSRVTTGSADITPRWVGNDRIVFVRPVDNQPAVVLKQLISGEERILARRSRFPTATADGRRVVFNILQEGGIGWQTAWIDLERPDEIHRLGGIHLGGRFPSVSPDGTLVTYISGEMGNDEVFLTRLPTGEGKWQLSRDGGGWTLFSPTGDAVLYRALTGAFMSVPIATKGELKVGQAQKLFDWGAGWLPFYDIADDGKRGIAAVTLGDSTHVPSVTIVQNWHLEFTGPRSAR
jgi:hypothetical protein